MGKSRLLHEFRQRIGKERAFVLSGSCSPDGQQTPFLPFIEVVRGSFRVIAGEAEKDVAQKLETGLTALGLRSTRNLGLLLHLLGLKVPEGALTGLDGVLIGLRTRELLAQSLEARCRLSPVVMVIEDLHWIDSVSEEVFGRNRREPREVAASAADDAPAGIRAALARPRSSHQTTAGATAGGGHPPLGSGAARSRGSARGAGAAGDEGRGNPLFVEEIVSFLTERGMLRAAAGKLEFDASAVAGSQHRGTAFIKERININALKLRENFSRLACHCDALVFLFYRSPVTPLPERSRNTLLSVYAFACG